MSAIQQSARFVAGLLSDGMSVAICYLPLKLLLWSKASSMFDDTAVKQSLYHTTHETWVGHRMRTVMC